MKLWLLRPVEGLDRTMPTLNPWADWYDKAFGFVIRAESEEAARRLLTRDDIGAEGAEAWINPSYSTCTELVADGPAGVVICDFARA